jgi:gamma-glutamyltranspeptidase
VFGDAIARVETKRERDGADCECYHCIRYRHVREFLSSTAQARRVDRASALGTRFMVSAPHAGAARVGAGILAGGGTAADAAIGVAASLCTLYPHMTGIGGDVFALYHEAASGTVHAYNGSGAAAALANLEYYRGKGHAVIPERGGAAALTVPGTVDSWSALHERFGTIDMQQLLAPAIESAEHGAPIARSLARSLREERELLAADDGGKAIFASAAWQEGDVLRQPALARTLRSIAKHGRNWFYEGEAAALIEQCCRRVGSPLRVTDLAAHRGFWTLPLRSDAFGAQSLTTAPNSQGLTLLIAQGIYEEYAQGRALTDCSAPFVHAAIEASRLAYADRDRSVSDPHANPAPVNELLSRVRLQKLARTIDPDRAAIRESAASQVGGTTYFACVDSAGNAASVIQSIYMHFGSTVVVPELGIALHNRGCWFTLDEDQPRSLVPGRRPFHTLIANMLVRDAKPWIVYGSMGGDGQPQTGLALSIRMAAMNVKPQAAIDAPRWRWSATPGNGAGVVAVEGRMKEACIAGLMARGHRIEVAEDSEEFMGHAGAIMIDRQRGLLLGASDPRSDGAAIGA